jgi:hypothetical protein
MLGQPRPCVNPKPTTRLSRRKRVTVALGILAGRSIVIAADTEESVGEDKLDVLKTSAASPIWSGPSGLAITGAGNGWYIDAITQELERHHDSLAVAITLDQVKVEFEKLLMDFYRKHVVPFRDAADLDFQLLIGAQRGGFGKLWVTFRNSMKEVVGHEVVGVGDTEAKLFLTRIYGIDSPPFGVLAACSAVYQAKQRIKDCGRGTTIVCLNDNTPHYIYPDVIEMAEKWFAKYLRTESSSLMFSMGRHFPDGFIDKITSWHSDLRQEAEGIMDRISHDIGIYVPTPSVSQTSVDQP